MRTELQLEVENETQLPGALQWVQRFVKAGLPGGTVRISLGRPRRTLDQNQKLWPLLHDVARQVPWQVDGETRKISEENWKDIFTAALKQQRMVPGIDGGIVVLGAHTSRMSKREMSELIELIQAFGAQHGVTWTEEADAHADTPSHADA